MDQLALGDITISALLDGEISFPLERMFPGVDPARFVPYGGLEDGALLFGLSTFVVCTAGRTLLVDTGIGRDVSPLVRFGFSGVAGSLPSALAGAGIDPTTVDAVVLTHLHSDHIGWNTDEGSDGTLRPLFPNARYVVTSTDWEHRLKLAGRAATARSLDPVEAAGQLTLVEDGYDVAPGVSLLATPGHTPGHASVLVMGGGGEGAIITGDALHHPAEIDDPDLSPAFDTDPAQSAASRRLLIERAEAEGLAILGGHFPQPAAGNVVRVGDKRAWRWLGATPASV